MQPAAVIRILKPNVTSLGYALFLAINAAGVWGGVFPFLPLEFQTPEIVFWFFLAQSLVFSASYFASAFGVYFLPGPTRRFMVMLAAAPYFLGWCSAWERSGSARASCARWPSANRRWERW